MVGERLPRPAGRRAQPLLLVLVRAEHRLARPLLAPRRAAGVRRAHARTSTASPTHVRFETRGTRRRVRPGRPRGGRCGSPATATPSPKPSSNAVVSAVGMLNRPLVPDALWPRLVRRDAVPLLALAGRPRRDREARRRHRHRCQRGAAGSRRSRPDVAHLDVFQRSRHWMMPNPLYLARDDRRRAVAHRQRSRTTRAGTASSSSGTTSDRMYTRSASTPTGSRPSARSARRTTSCASS